MPAPPPERPRQGPSAPAPAPAAGGLSRAIGFIGQVARQMKDEFAVAWEATAELPAERTAGLTGRLGALLAKVEEAETALAGSRPLEGGQVEALVELASGTEQLAAELRSDPALAAARATQQRQALATRRAMPTRPLSPSGPLGTARPAAPPPQDPRVVRARMPFDQAHQFAGKALAYADPRLSVVAIALEAVGPPGRPAPPEEMRTRLAELCRQARLPASRYQWASALASRLAQDPETARKVAVAVEQWRQATALFAEAEAVRARLDGDPAAALAALAGFHPGKLRASVFPIGHLHLTFRGVPQLGELFPPPPNAAVTSRLDRAQA